MDGLGGSKDVNIVRFFKNYRIETAEASGVLAPGVDPSPAKRDAVDASPINPDIDNIKNARCRVNQKGKIASPVFD
jgi:hypothetical protein